MRQMARKKVLFVISEWGYWGEELVGPLSACDKAGYEVVFVTPTGKKPKALTVSMDPSYIDPPLGKSVTSEENARLTREIEQSDRLNNPINLKEWFPERPYRSSPNYLRESEAYYQRLDELEKELAQYDALVIVGGSGAMVDLANNQRLHDMILRFVKMDKPVAAECYGVACLAFARDAEDRKSIIWGKHVTGHPFEYDYKDGTGFEGDHPGLGPGLNMGPPFYPLEFILRDAVGPNGQFHGNVGKETSVIVDYPFITARSTESSYACGEMLIEVLEKGLRKYGFVAR